MPIKSVERLTGHWTKEQIEARKRQQGTIARDRVTLKATDAVKNDLVAAKYWKDTIRRMKGISLLDDLDTDMLAAYCLQSSLRDGLRSQYQADGLDSTLRLLQVQERLILAYAGKLGLTAESRMRLAKKAAEDKPLDPDEKMFGD